MNDKATAIANTAAYTTAAANVVAGLSFSQWMILGGFLLSIATYATSFYFQYMKMKRERENETTINHQTLDRLVKLLIKESNKNGRKSPEE